MTAAGLSETLLKVLIEAGSLLAFGWTMAFHPEAARRAMLLLAPLFGLAFCGFISALGNDQGLLAGALFVRQSIGPSLLVACGLVVARAARATRALCGLALACLAFQPCVALVKLITVGIDEKQWIGTLHQSAGQLGLLLPMVGIATAIPLAVIYRPAVVLFVPLFVLFGIVGEKRAIVIVLPLVIVLTAALSLIVVRKRLGLDSAWAHCGARCRAAMGAVLIISLVESTVGGILSIASLNPTNVDGGGIEAIVDSPGSIADRLQSLTEQLSYAVGYVHDYLLRDFDHAMNKSEQSVEENTNIQLGQLRIIVEASRAVARFDTPQLLFGLGGSAVDESYLLGANRNDVIFSALGLRGPTACARSSHRGRLRRVHARGPLVAGGLRAVDRLSEAGV